MVFSFCNHVCDEYIYALILPLGHRKEPLILVLDSCHPALYYACPSANLCGPMPLRI